MHLLLVNYEYPPVGGGAATATQALARALVERGHEVIVLTGQYQSLPPVAEENGIVVHRVRCRRAALDRAGIFEMGSFLVSALMSAPSLVRQHRIGGVIAFFALPCGPIGLLCRWRCGVPYVVSLRGGDVPGTEPSLDLAQRLLAPIRRAVLKNSVAIVANSEGLRKMAEAADPFSVRVIPNGVDGVFFIPVDRTLAKKKETPLRILFVGRFQKQKNLAFLLKQAARLPSDAFQLHLVGDGPERLRLQRLAQELGLAAKITWRGWLDRAGVRAAYQSADCLVNPSLYEGMSNVVLEAMSCGLPVIASNVPGNDVLVLEGETGFLFDLRAPEMLNQALERLIDDRVLCSRLGMQARDHVTKGFSWRRVAEGYLALFGHDSKPVVRTENQPGPI